MSKKNYTDEFRRDAVALYRDTVGATVARIATDLGISPRLADRVAQKGRGPDPKTPNNSDPAAGRR